MKTVLKVLKYIALSILVFLACVCISVFIQTKTKPNKIPAIFGYKPFIVMSGSMEAELYKGDLVVVKDVDKKTIKKSDIIAFRDKKNHVVTHRIVEVINDNGKKAFITKGDNNDTTDVGAVYLNNIEGKYVFKIAKVGNVLLVLQKPMTLFIMLTVILIIGIVWIMIGNNKLSKEERKELEELRNQKKKK